MKIPALLAALTLSFLPHLEAQTALTTQHVDIGLAEGAGLGAHWHDEEYDAEYEPSEAYAYIDPVLAKLTNPGSAQWAFLGGQGGDPIWVLPQSQNPGILFLGIGAEDAVPGTFDLWNPGDPRSANSLGRWIELSLVSVSGPGDFSVWRTDGFGSPVPLMSTAVPLSSGNRLFVAEGGHAHYNWGFTAEGTYDVNFQVRAFIDGVEVQQWATFTFSTTAIPEPSTALLGMVAVGMGQLLRRKRREIL